MSLKRVHYREHQLLRRADLQIEQDYRLGMHRRHNIGPHRWGIVRGLEIQVNPGEPPTLQPGLAVDGYGRELLVPQPLVVPPANFDTLKSAALDFWLCYRLAPVNITGPGYRENGSGRPDRWRDEAYLRLTPVIPNTDTPPALPAFSPSQLQFGEPEKEWPVYLGRVVRDTATPPTYTFKFRENRPYCELVGQQVNAPSGSVRMQLDNELATDPNRFAVSLPGTSPITPLALDQKGELVLRTNTNVAASLSVASFDKNDDKPASYLNFRPLPAPPTTAAPWQFYYALVPPAGQPPTQAQGQAQMPPTRQLRLELAHPGEKDDPARYRLVIGHRDAKSQEFVPCLAVAADGTVTIYGNLETRRPIVESPVKPDPDDPRFTQGLLNSWLSAADSSSRQVEGLYAGQLVLSLPQQFKLSQDGKTLTYNLTITNSGTASVTNIELYLTETLGQQNTRNERAFPATRPSQVILRPGKSLPLELSYTGQDVLSGSRLTVAATAIGVGPNYNVISGKAEVEFDIPGQLL